MSMSARKQQEDNVERLVKCRLRSETEARKALESTMKRAVQETRELKKELVLLRQEKEELREMIRKNVIANGGKDAAHTDKGTGRQAVELKLRQHIQTLSARNTELESSENELKLQLSKLESQNTVAITQMTNSLEEKDCEVVALQKEMKKTKGVIDETKRKYQKILKEKKEEAQIALQENEQLARCVKTLQSELTLLPQLKKQLEHAKEKRADAATVWQKKLEQRDQAFLREEEANKQKLSERSAQIAELTEENQDLHARLEVLESKRDVIDNDLRDELSHKSERLTVMEDTVKQLQKKLFEAEAVAQESNQAEVMAKEMQQQEAHLRQLAEDAADAVENRAHKAEHKLLQVKEQLDRIEEALKARGVTLDYLLKQQTPISVAARAPTLGKSTRGAKVNGDFKKTVAGASTRRKIMVKPQSAAKDANTTKGGTSNNNGEDNVTIQ